MRIWEYIKDKAGILIGYLLFIAIMLIAFRAMRTPGELTVIFLVLTVLLLVTVILTDYIKRRHFYNSLYAHMEQLDQKYLVMDTLEEPGFYEGKLVYEALYEINKSMTEHVKEYRQSVDDFKDFIEIWVHEIKLPIASLVLMCHNNQDKIPKKYEDQVNRLDAYADQVLYYVRAEHASKDYRFDSVRIKSVVNKVALKNKDMLLESDICLDVHDVDVSVTTDAKWLEFMINQIMSNSIKYKDDNKDTSVIRISAVQDKKSIELRIYDNGIGISGSDIPRVFDKSFTGENGRRYSKATGMGLYIVKKMCDKMGHDIYIESAIGEYTEVKMTFYKNDFYNVTKM